MQVQQNLAGLATARDLCNHQQPEEAAPAKVDGVHRYNISTCSEPHSVLHDTLSVNSRIFGVTMNV